MKNYQKALIAGLVFSTAVAGNVFAAEKNVNDALVVKDAKVELGQAVASAERSIDGKASRAELERYHDKWVYDVEVVKNDKVLDVKVDSISGKILSSTDDAIDHDSDRDQED